MRSLCTAPNELDRPIMCYVGYLIRLNINTVFRRHNKWPIIGYLSITI